MPTMILLSCPECTHRPVLEPLVLPQDDDAVDRADHQVAMVPDAMDQHRAWHACDGHTTTDVVVVVVRPPATNVGHSCRGYARDPSCSQDVRRDLTVVRWGCTCSTHIQGDHHRKNDRHDYNCLSHYSSSGTPADSTRKSIASPMVQRPIFSRR